MTERIECACGCGRISERQLCDSDVNYSFSDLAGVSVSMHCFVEQLRCGIATLAYRIRKHREKRASPLLITTQVQADSLFGVGSSVASIAGAAAESLETDESWCARQLAEYTGLPAHCVRRTNYGIDVTLDNGAHDGLMFCADLEHVRARDVAWFQAELAKCVLWPRAVAQSGKFYVTQPDPLPKMLPAGTRGTASDAPERLVLRDWGGRPCYMRESRLHSNGWAWPEQIAWARVPIQEANQPSDGVAAQQDCQHRFDQVQRRCLRCGLGEKEYEECESAKLKGTWGVDLAAGPSWSDVTIGGLRSPGIAPVRAAGPACRGCSSPAAPSSLDCSYCAHREYGLSEDDIRRRTEQEPGQIAARARMAQADRLERPRATADSRAFAKGHPWECGGEQEP